MKKLFFIAVLLQGITFSVYFGFWSIKDYVALEQEVALEHLEDTQSCGIG